MRRQQKEEIRRAKELESQIDADPILAKYFDSLDEKHDLSEHYFSFEDGKELALAGSDLIILPTSNVERATNLVDTENLEKVSTISVGNSSVVLYKKINPNELALALYDVRNSFLVYKI